MCTRVDYSHQLGSGGRLQPPADGNYVVAPEMMYNAETCLQRMLHKECVKPLRHRVKKKNAFASWL